jgi:hypothetical protein
VAPPQSLPCSGAHVVAGTPPRARHDTLLGGRGLRWDASHSGTPPQPVGHAACARHTLGGWLDHCWCATCAMCVRSWAIRRASHRYPPEAAGPRQTITRCTPGGTCASRYPAGAAGRAPAAAGMSGRRCRRHRRAPLLHTARPAEAAASRGSPRCRPGPPPRRRPRPLCRRAHSICRRTLTIRRTGSTSRRRRRSRRCHLTCRRVRPCRCR